MGDPVSPKPASRVSFLTVRTTSGLRRQITDEDVATYHRDGVVLLPGMFDDEWIDLLDDGLDTQLAAPTARARAWDRDTEGLTMFWDSQAWLDVKHYQRFVFESPAAEIAGRIMRASEVNFFFDAVFVRSPGTQFSTPWHQDEPYWSIDGYDSCTIWMPLVPVAAKSALAFVPGSHLGTPDWKQFNFGVLNPDDHTNVDQVDFGAMSAREVPDIDADPEAFGVISWAMEPGDCVVFNGRTMHGGSGKLDSGADLRVFTSKWLGDDARIIFRECGMDPDHSAIMTEYGLKPGDRPGTDLYPRVWTRSRS
jgi:ectoine hydroxylase-related dioxygenase (phytanoyl-CoA dioxygenase family)